jgi:biotin carboxylase
VQRYAFARPGKVTSISGEDDARRIPGIEEVAVTVQIGDMIPEPTHSGCTAAMVLATGASVAQARATAQAALNALRIETVA